MFPLSWFQSFLRLQKKTDSNLTYSTSKIIIDGTDYDVGMFCICGAGAGLPQFSKIQQILLVNDATFLCQGHKSQYIENLRSYELSPGNVTVHSVSELFLLHCIQIAVDAQTIHTVALKVHLHLVI